MENTVDNVYIYGLISLIIEIGKHNDKTVYKCLEAIDNLLNFLVERYGLKAIRKDLFKNGIVIAKEPRKLRMAIFKNDLLKLFRFSQAC